jgi:hypothetical protein
MGDLKMTKISSRIASVFAAFCIVSLTMTPSIAQAAQVIG